MSRSIHSEQSPKRFLFLALLSLTFVLSILATNVTASEQSGIRVSAIGTSSVEPELARINLSFEHTAETADIARDFTSNQVSKLLNSLKGFDIDKESMDSSQVNIAPRYNYQDGERSLEGYQVTRFVNFSLSNLEQLEPLINAITATEVSRVNTIRFDVKDASEAHAIALQNAIEKTKSAAQVIAKSYGAELGQIQYVEHNIEHSDHPAPSSMRAMTMEAKSADSNDTYQIKKIEFKARVSSTFELD